MFGLVDELDIANLALLVVRSIPNIDEAIDLFEKINHRLVVRYDGIVTIILAVVLDHLDASLRGDLDREKHPHLEIGVQVEMIVSEYVPAQRGGKPAVCVATCKPNVVEHDKLHVFPLELEITRLVVKGVTELLHPVRHLSSDNDDGVKQRVRVLEANLEIQGQTLQLITRGRRRGL